MRFTLISLALLLSAGLAFSQGGGITFRTLGISSSKFPELWVIDSGKPVAIAFSSKQPSLPLKADRISPLPIFKGPLNATGKPSDTTPSKVPLPASSSLLLLGWMDGEKPGFLAIDDPFSTAKSDDWLVINPSQSEVAIQIGATAKPIPIKANSNQAIKNTAPAGVGAAVTIAAKQPDGSWKAIYSAYWPIHANRRGLVVVSQRGERFHVNYLPEKLAAPPAPAP
jgi:hypothetical protein